MGKERRPYNCNASKVSVVFGDITESELEVIASSDDTLITMSGGVSRAILDKGGSQIQLDARKQLPSSVGDVVVSSAGNMPQKYIFHCLTIDEKYLEDTWEGLNVLPEEKVEEVIRIAVRKCFHLLKALNLNSIALPVIGSGAAHMPFLSVVEIMADEISQELMKTNKKLEVEIYIFDSLKKYGISEIDLFEKISFKFAIANYIIQHNSDVVSYENNPIKLSDDDLLYYKNQQHDVFISYKREESDIAFAIKDLLESWKINTWIDKHGIFSSYDFKEVIEKAIEKTKVVLFLSSEKSNQSPYVKKEIKYAIGCNKRIIPVMLDKTPFGDGIRMDLFDIDQTDYSNSKEFQRKLKTSLNRILTIEDFQRNPKDRGEDC